MKATRHNGRSGKLGPVSYTHLDVYKRQVAAYEIVDKQAGKDFYIREDQLAIDVYKRQIQSRPLMGQQGSQGLGFCQRY